MTAPEACVGGAMVLGFFLGIHAGSGWGPSGSVGSMLSIGHPLGVNFCEVSLICMKREY
jgi:hypothetical protein